MMLEAITRCDRHPLKCYIEPPTVNIVISKLTMALEDKKIKYLKWIIYSIWNRDHKLGEAVKLLGWFGVFLGIFLCAVSLYTFSSAGDLKNKDETYITALYVMGGIYMGVGLVHIIFNIALLVKIGQSFVGEKEDTEIYQLIRTMSLIWTVLDLPLSLLAVLGILRSSKTAVKVYIFLRLAGSLLILLGLVLYLVLSSCSYPLPGAHNLSVLGLAAGGLLCFLQYHLNLSVLHLNMMDTPEDPARTS